MSLLCRKVEFVSLHFILKFGEFQTRISLINVGPKALTFFQLLACLQIYG